MTNVKIQMTKQIQSTNGQKTKNKYDLEDRTLLFAKACIDLCKALPKDIISTPFIGQLLRASSSVGANYREANDSISRKDFDHRIGICRRESKESKYWLDLLGHANPQSAGRVTQLSEEAIQLARIFSTINQNRGRR